MHVETVILHMTHAGAAAGGIMHIVAELTCIACMRQQKLCQDEQLGKEILPFRDFWVGPTTVFMSWMLPDNGALTGCMLWP